MGLFTKDKVVETAQSTLFKPSADEYQTYLLVEHGKKTVYNYLCNHGIVCTYCDNSIENVKNRFIMDGRPALLVVIESGRGDLTAITNRREVADLIGTADEDIKKLVIVLTTDALLRTECGTIGKRKEIVWLPYDGTKSVYKALKRSGLRASANKRGAYDIRVNPQLQFKDTGVILDTVPRFAADKLVEKLHQSIINGEEDGVEKVSLRRNAEMIEISRQEARQARVKKYADRLRQAGEMYKRNGLAPEDMRVKLLELKEKLEARCRAEDEMDELRGALEVNGCIIPYDIKV